ncbi:hypothetical protein GWN15_16035, partial [candidate division KSB1 bacterium]|nr:hypothetical protein [candidate division KSB1 bacterium]
MKSKKQKKNFHVNPSTEPGDERAPNEEKPVPAGALAKAFARMQDLANAAIAAITNFDNARKGMNKLYWFVHRKLEQFNHNRLYLQGAVVMLVATIAGEVSVSWEYLKTLTIMVAVVLVSAIVFSGITGTTLMVRGFHLRKTNRSQATFYLCTGLGLLLVGAGTLLYFSYARTQYYASYGDIRQYTTALPLLLFVVECACGWFAERYLRYWQLQREQRAITDEWNDLLET